MNEGVMRETRAQKARAQETAKLTLDVGLMDGEKKADNIRNNGRNFWSGVLETPRKEERKRHAIKIYIKQRISIERVALILSHI